jgi:hypothetical protein
MEFYPRKTGTKQHLIYFYDIWVQIIRSPCQLDGYESQPVKQTLVMTRFASVLKYYPGQYSTNCIGMMAS